MYMPPTKTCQQLHTSNIALTEATNMVRDVPNKSIPTKQYCTLLTLIWFASGSFESHKAPMTSEVMNNAISIRNAENKLGGHKGCDQPPASRSRMPMIGSKKGVNFSGFIKRNTTKLDERTDMEMPRPNQKTGR
jgi:hypothetical protein